MNTEMNTEMKELNLDEMEQVSGGWWPIVIVAGVAAYCFYKGITEGKKSGWK